MSKRLSVCCRRIEKEEHTRVDNDLVEADCEQRKNRPKAEWLLTVQETWVQAREIIWKIPIK